MLRDVETLNVMSTISVAIYVLLVLKVCLSQLCVYRQLGQWQITIVFHHFQSFFEVGYQSSTVGISPNIELWRFGGVLQCVPIFSMALSCQTQVDIEPCISKSSLNQFCKILILVRCLKFMIHCQNHL